ncbi:glycosyltransferase [Candidatus Woesearchaeota archaeon]|nr:glycosyltransferase [Candidatus Woesearchaeota archaeon]
MKVLVFGSSAFPRWRNDPFPDFVYGLSRRLFQEGCDVAVLVPHHPGSKLFEVVDGMRVYRFRYFVPSSLERLCYGAGIFANMKNSFLARLQLPFLVAAEFFSLWYVAKKEKPDVIHAHWILPQGLAAAMVGRLLEIPVVVTAHAGDVFPLNNAFFRLLSGLALGSASAITANSTYTKSAVGRMTRKPVSVIPMGVDLALFSSSSASAAAAVRKKHGLSPGSRMILFVGRLAEKKGVKHLIDAMRRIARAFPACRLVVVGDGPEKASLVRQSQQLGLPESVVFAGSIPNRELPEFYRAADVFVLPSVVAKSGDTEGLGVVLLEAIAAGCPVVASNVGGIPDIVIDRKTGLLVEQKNPEKLAMAVISLLRSASLRRRLAFAAKRHVSGSYSWGRVARKFSELLSTAAGRK